MTSLMDRDTHASSLIISLLSWMYVLTMIGLFQLQSWSQLPCDRASSPRRVGSDRKLPSVQEGGPFTTDLIVYLQGLRLPNGNDGSCKTVQLYDRRSPHHVRGPCLWRQQDGRYGDRQLRSGSVEAFHRCLISRKALKEGVERSVIIMNGE